MPSITYPPPKPFEKVMVFIDGGYFRELYRKHCGNESINFENLLGLLVQGFDHHPNNRFQANLIRAYYYDAIVDKNEPEYDAQKQYFDAIFETYPYTIRLGRLVKSSDKGFKQKGVDILMAVDAIGKAYQNHYDTGIFLLGDADFIPLIKGVKDAGKKTMLVYHKTNSSKELIKTFDMHSFLEESALKMCMKQS